MGLALLLLAFLVTLFGRHGQRLLNGALLGCGAGALAFFGLRGATHLWVPGVAAVVASVLAALFGVVAAGWATAALCALFFATAARSLASLFKLWWVPVSALAAGLGLFAGMANHLRLSVVLPPLFSAVFVAWGCAIAWAPNWRGAALWQLNDLDWVLGFAAVMAAVLLPLSLEREHRKKLRLASRTRNMDDEDLKKQLAVNQAARERFQRINPPE